MTELDHSRAGAPEGLSAEAFLDSTRQDLADYYLPADQKAKLAEAGRYMYRPAGYLEDLFADESDHRVTDTARLADAYVSGVALGRSDIAEKAEALLGENRNQVELLGLLLNQISKYYSLEKDMQDDYGEARLGRLRTERTALYERFQEQRQLAKAARKAGRTAGLKLFRKG